MIESGVSAFRVDAPIKGEGLLRTVVKSDTAPKTYGILSRLTTEEPGRKFAVELREFNAVKRLGLLVPVERAPERVVFSCTLDDSSLKDLSSESDFSEDADEDVRTAWIVNPGVRIQNKSESFDTASELWQRVAMLGAHEIVWIEDQFRRLTLPYWLNDFEANCVRQLLSGELMANNLGGSMRRKFTGIGLIYTQKWLSHNRRMWSAKFANARRNISGRGYAVLRDLIPTMFLQSLCRYYRNLVVEGFLIFGDQQAMRYNLHNEPFSFWLHRFTEPFIARAIPEPVKSSYSYVAAYLPGATLGRHTDRLQCEYTLSLSIDATPNPTRSEAWPLYLDSPVDGGIVGVSLGAGDGLIFKGRELPHFRSQLRESCTASSLLFHYVPSDFEGPLLAGL
jgi:hypothetical protein